MEHWDIFGVECKMEKVNIETKWWNHVNGIDIRVFKSYNYVCCVCNVWFDDAMNWLWYIWIARQWISIIYTLVLYEFRIYQCNIFWPYFLASRSSSFQWAHFFYSYWTRESIQSTYFLWYYYFEGDKNQWQIAWGLVFEIPLKMRL